MLKNFFFFIVGEIEKILSFDLQILITSKYIFHSPPPQIIFSFVSTAICSCKLFLKQKTEIKRVTA